MRIKKFIVNPLQENSYVISDETDECIMIDPGFYYPEEENKVKEYIRTNGLKPVMVVNTHCHFDHIMGVEFLREEYNIPFIAHADESFWVENAVEQAEMFGFEMEPVNAPDDFIDVNGPIKFGTTELKVIHLPGHSPGHVVFYSEDDLILIAGDVLFYGSIGRTDLPGGNYRILISGIKEKLFTLPGRVKVYCGHGPETKLDFEKSSNPFLV
jgi:glyoxylase-like metal-dependent hydrolase (beta-lactamase superfamily II)